MCITLCSDNVWLKANQSVCTHEMSSVCLVTEKGLHWDYPCCHHIILTSLSQTIEERRKNHTVFVGSCLVSTVSHHVRSTQKERIHIHKVVAELVVSLRWRGSCREQDFVWVGIVGDIHQCQRWMTMRKIFFFSNDERNDKVGNWLLRTARYAHCATVKKKDIVREDKIDPPIYTESEQPPWSSSWWHPS